MASNAALGVGAGLAGFALAWFLATKRSGYPKEPTPPEPSFIESHQRGTTWYGPAKIGLPIPGFQVGSLPPGQAFRMAM